MRKIRVSYDYCSGGYYIRVGRFSRWVPYSDWTSTGNTPRITSSLPNAYEQGDTPAASLKILKQMRDEIDIFLRVASKPVILTCKEGQPGISCPKQPQQMKGTKS